MTMSSYGNPFSAVLISLHCILIFSFLISKKKNVPSGCHRRKVWGWSTFNTSIKSSFKAASDHDASFQKFTIIFCIVQSFMKENMPRLHKLSQKTEDDGMRPESLYEASIILAPKPKGKLCSKENHRPISFPNILVKVRSTFKLANFILQYRKV